MVDTSFQAVILWPSWWKQATVVCTVFQDTWSQPGITQDQMNLRNMLTGVVSLSLSQSLSIFFLLSLSFSPFVSFFLLLFHSLHFTGIYLQTDPTPLYPDSAHLSEGRVVLIQVLKFLSHMMQDLTSTRQRQQMINITDDMMVGLLLHIFSCFTLCLCLLFVAIFHTHTHRRVI